MSLFDPYQLYKREQFNTHTGQVLRKKPPLACGTPVTEEQFSNFIDIAKSFGYHIYPPSYHIPPNKYYRGISFVYDYGKKDYNYPTTNQPYQVKINDFWNSVIFPNFDFSHLPEEIDNFIFTIRLNSFSAWQYENYTTGSRRYSFLAWRENRLQAFRIGSGSLETLDNQWLSQFGFSVKSYNQNLLLIDSYTPSSNMEKGYFLINKPADFGSLPAFITQLTTEDIQDYAKMRISDPDFLNNIPPLFTWNVEYNTDVPDHCPIGALHHHIVAIEVLMEYRIKP